MERILPAGQHQRYRGRFRDFFGQKKVTDVQAPLLIEITRLIAHHI